MNSHYWYSILPSNVINISPKTLVFQRIKGLSSQRTVSALYKNDDRDKKHLLDFMDMVSQSVAELNKEQ